MLNKLFGKKKPKNPSPAPVHSRALAVPTGPPERGSRALKIIHPGGQAEYHYMAIPAAWIIDKYPSFILARPDIFKRPWGAIVRPEEVLIPGQKLYVVPRQTVKKLRRRTKKSTVGVNPGFSFESNFSQNEKHSQSSISVSGILVKPGPKSKTHKHVQFFGVDTTKKKVDSVPFDGKKGNKIEKGLKGNPQIAEKRKARNENGWEPSLNSIQE